MLCFKIMKGFVDIDASEFFERVPLDSVIRGHCFKLVYPFGLMLDNNSFQFELFRFGILLRQMLLRPSRFLVSMRVSLKKSLKNL